VVAQLVRHPRVITTPLSLLVIGACPWSPIR
jgi:hypothetical protein